MTEDRGLQPSPATAWLKPRRFRSHVLLRNDEYSFPKYLPFRGNLILIGEAEAVQCRNPIGITGIGITGIDRRKAAPRRHFAGPQTLFALAFQHFIESRKHFLRRQTFVWIQIRWVHVVRNQARAAFK
jgi:hypothetical protein